MPGRINGDDLWKNGTNLHEARKPRVQSRNCNVDIDIGRASQRDVIIDYLYVYNTICNIAYISLLRVYGYGVRFDVSSLLVVNALCLFNSYEIILFAIDLW